MNNDSSVPYPGTETEPRAVLLLANQYACAARLLFTEKSLKQALRLPAMFCAIHAIELYLNAAIIASGETPETLRRMHHNFSQKSSHHGVVALRLRKKTQDHLASLSDKKDYLIVRYAPDQKHSLSELNRLKATLDGVAKKVGTAFDQKKWDETQKAG